MTRNIFSLLLFATCALCLSACSDKEDRTTTEYLLNDFYRTDVIERQLDYIESVDEKNNPRYQTTTCTSIKILKFQNSSQASVFEAHSSACAAIHQQYQSDTYGKASEWSTFKNDWQYRPEEVQMYNYRFDDYRRLLCLSNGDAYEITLNEQKIERLTHESKPLVFNYWTNVNSTAGQ